MYHPLNKKPNEYADTLGDLLNKTPKNVMAAIIASEALNRHSINPQVFLLAEWRRLYAQGLVPQKPPKEA